MGTIIIMEFAHELMKDLDLLKITLGKIQMVGRFGYKKENEAFVDIVKGFKILQNMAEYLLEKIGGLKVSMLDTCDSIMDKDFNNADTTNDVDLPENFLFS